MSHPLSGRCNPCPRHHYRYSGAAGYVHRRLTPCGAGAARPCWILAVTSVPGSDSQRRARIPGRASNSSNGVSVLMMRDVASSLADLQVAQRMPLGAACWYVAIVAGAAYDTARAAGEALPLHSLRNTPPQPTLFHRHPTLPHSHGNHRAVAAGAAQGCAFKRLGADIV
jgi:hypothetical protein